MNTDSENGKVGGHFLSGLRVLLVFKPKRHWGTEGKFQTNIRPQPDPLHRENENSPLVIGRMGAVNASSPHRFKVV